jgi:hypothetical protein
MNSNNGGIITSNSYGKEDDTKLHKLTKAVLINSNVNAAYIISNGPTQGSGYQIFRYDPSLVTAQNATWAYKFTGNPWGIVYGR